MNQPVLELVSALMSGHGFTRDQALAEIKSMREDVRAGANPEEVLYEAGLEPDYFFALL